jgi:hypothetical protein
MRLGRGSILLILSSVGASGCKDITRFSTAPGESYCGPIVDASFVLRGFPQTHRMRMTFDADRVADAPGTLSTDDQLLTNSPLRPLPEVMNDPLSTLNFGEGRDKNLLFAVDPTDPARGPTIMAVISLMHGGDAEVRLFRGAPIAPGAGAVAGDGEPLFGVFAPLTRQPGQCSF